MEKGNKILKAALWYCEHGFNVVPLAHGTKVPPKDFKLDKYQTLRSTSDDIYRWFKQYQKMNIGIMTGAISDLLVIDLDKYKPDYSEEEVLKYIPDTFITPTVVSPRGGQHLWCRMPPIAISGSRATGKIPGIDIRAEGNYIVAPPSVNEDGLAYAFASGAHISELERIHMPATLLDYYSKDSSSYNNNNNIYYNRARTGLEKSDDDPSVTGVTSVTDRDMWADGTRDESLFHLALSLQKTNNSQEYIRQTLRAVVSSWGEKDEAWIDAKIRSAIDYREKGERNLQATIDEYISVTTGDFSVTDMDKELGIVTPRDKGARRKCISRRKDKTIEKAGIRDGWWRRIDTDVAFMDFDEPEEESSPIMLPFQLHELVNVCQGNIILSAGEFNSGKTTFALNCLVMNKNRMKIRYISSEMKVGEIKKRFRLFGLPKEAWWPDENCQYVALGNNLCGSLLPDGLNIIDYLEFPGSEYNRAAEYFRNIHDKLTTGVAVVCIQKKENQRMPRSGDMALEKPRLAITFTKMKGENDSIVGIAEVLKAKNVSLGKMDGKRLKYEITNNGSQFKTLIPWGWWR